MTPLTIANDIGAININALAVPALFALVVLVGIIFVSGKLDKIASALENLASSISANPAAPVPTAAYAAPAAAPAPQQIAPPVELNGVDEETAAVVMAIVAHESGKPIESLIFKSVKEVF